MDQIHLAQDRVNLQILVKIVMNSDFHKELC
jgi:hypothetical protein